MKTEFHKLSQCLPFTAPGYGNAERKEAELQPFISVSSVNTLSSVLEISSDETKTKSDMLDLLALLALAAWSHRHLLGDGRAACFLRPDPGQGEIFVEGLNKH